MGSQFPFYSEVGTGPAESRLLAAELSREFRQPPGLIVQ